MTNTTYFDTVVRDAYSSSSSSSQRSPETSHRHSVEIRGKETIKSNVKAFSVLSILGFNPRGVRYDGREHPHSSFKSSNFKNFSFEEIKTATGNPLYELFLGVDVRDREFKGWIYEQDLTAAKPRTGIAIVVKLLDREHMEDHEGCMDEVRYLGQLSHPNLVKLFGYCSVNQHHLLVSELMPRTLEDHLFKWASLLLPWSLRMNVALGVAKGLAFLHRAQVIYREFRTSNIHLDTNYNVKLSDFGLPKNCLSGGKSHVAPEYHVTGRQTAKIDVYSFGMLLLELLSGRQASEFEEQKLGSPSQYYNMGLEFGEEQGMVEWARSYLDANISYIIDHRLKGQYSLKSAHKIANLAFECLATVATMRPDMDQVVAELEQLQDSKYMKIIKCKHEHESIGYEELLDSHDTRRHKSEEVETDSEEDMNSQDMKIMHEEQSLDLDMVATMEEERESMLLDGR